MESIPTLLKKEKRKRSIKESGAIIASMELENKIMLHSAITMATGRMGKSMERES